MSKPECTEPDMVLRDHFATMVLPSVFAQFCNSFRDGDIKPDATWPMGVASDAYLIADAMLAVRDRKDKHTKH